MIQNSGGNGNGALPKPPHYVIRLTEDERGVLAFVLSQQTTVVPVSMSMLMLSAIQKFNLAKPETPAEPAAEPEVRRK